MTFQIDDQPEVLQNVGANKWFTARWTNNNIPSDDFSIVGKKT
jgi:hypothetical protein